MRQRTARRSVFAAGLVVAALGAFAVPAGALTIPSAPPTLVGTAGKPIAKTTLTWTVPTDTGGGIATYLYKVSTDYDPGTTTGTFGPFVDMRRKSLGATVKCLAVYPAVCTYQVYARNAAGTSAPSPVFTVPWSVPSAPRNLLKSSPDFSDVTLDWHAPANTGGLPVTYDVAVSNNKGASWTTLATSVSGLSYFAPASCTSGTECRYQVFARNSVGVSVSGSNVSTLNVAPGPLQTVALGKSADDLTVGNASSGKATMVMSWTSAATTGLADGPYQLQECVEVCGTFSPGWSGLISIPHATLSASRTCAAGLTTCSYRVRATNTRGGKGPWILLTYSPSAPIGVSAATGVTASTIAVTFSGPSRPGTATALSFYRFQVCSAADCSVAGNWSTSATTAAYPPATQPATQEVLCPASGVSCSVRVQFVNDAGKVSMVSPSASAVSA